MKDSDKELLKSSALTVIDEAVSMVPGLGLAWNLSKGLYGNSLKMRQQRALEWVEMVHDHPNVFVEELLSNEAFQNAFAYCLEDFITERSEQKRQLAKAIFLGFANTDASDDYPLERFVMTLRQMSETDIETIAAIDLEKASGDDYQIYEDSSKNDDNITNLVQLGILQFVGWKIIGDNGVRTQTVRMTEYGKKFISYVLAV